jgi:P27 family predicted phage terminase small subunit
VRGRKPKPSYLRVLDGNASHSRIPNPEEPQPSGDLADPPPELDPRQAAIWRYAIEHAPPGMLKLIDCSVFAAWVCAVATFEVARERVAALGLLLKSKEGVPYQNPYLSIQNKQATLIRQIAGDLGFSPTSRPRIKADQPKKGPNPFAALKSFDE